MYLGLKVGLLHYEAEGGKARGVYQRDVEVKVQFSASSGTFWIKNIQMLIHLNEK